ncbi:MAG: hypothetical protein K2Q18_11650, partial [Bdellovibrionales bacterium]|nr:hypothetical protein [Bdellovibrionales bacterium]
IISKTYQMKDLLSAYPHVSVAHISDNDAILDFYHQTSLSSSESEIHYSRGQDFFAFLKERSKDFLVLLLKDDEGQIQGMGVISFRNGYINGQLQTIGYLGDLRVKMNRKLIREWRSMYADLMKHSPYLRETFYCRYYQTVLIDENLESQNNLAMTKIKHLAYNRILGYEMVNIIGRFKLRTSKENSRFGSLEDRNIVLEFLKENSPKDFFAHDWNLELEHRLSTWKDFDMSSLILAFEKSKLVAVSMVWNPIGNKQVSIDKIPTFIKVFHTLVKLLPFFELKALPIEKKPLEILYLNQLIFSKNLTEKSKKKLTHEFIRVALKKKCHMVAYADFENEKFLENAWEFVMNKMAMALYSVHFKEGENNIQNPIEWKKDSPTPTFDMSLV